MKKMAIFVEGYTEVVFVMKLIIEIAGNRVMIEHKELRGGGRNQRTMKILSLTKPKSDQVYYVLIVDCGSDGQVKTRIYEEYPALVKAGYSRILGIRDIRGKLTHEDIPKLESHLPKYLKTVPIQVQFVLAIMETEAWFLAETDHYSKIDPSITLSEIRTKLGFDPENDDMQQRLTPSDDLNDCYAIGGKTYLKGKKQITLEALDFARIYLELHAKFPYLSQLVKSIDEFLT